MNSSEKLKDHIWTIAVKIHFTSITSFSKVMWRLQLNDLQLLQFNIWPKCRNLLSEIPKHTIHLEELWKYIWRVAMKIYFKNIITFTKATWPLQYSDLQSLRFGIRKKGGSVDHTP